MPKSSTRTTLALSAWENTKILVDIRDARICARCRRGCSHDFSRQHRIAGGMGGRSERTNQPSNIVTLCGSATTGCHQWVESHPDDARALGYRLDRGADPTVERVWWQGVWVLLDDLGSVHPIPFEETL